MRSIQESTQSFIVRVWIEPREGNNAEPIWRGVIEHVGSDDRVYFDQLEQLGIYLALFIEAMREDLDKS